MDIWIGDQHILLPPHIILALVCLALIIRFRRQVVGDYKKWTDTQAIIPASLNPSPPPSVTMSKGMGGCLWSMGGAIVMFVLGLILVDLLFAKGAYLADVLTVLFGG